LRACVAEERSWLMRDERDSGILPMYSLLIIDIFALIAMWAAKQRLQVLIATDEAPLIA
jgi:hypothetical protein